MKNVGKYFSVAPSIRVTPIQIQLLLIQYNAWNTYIHSGTMDAGKTTYTSQLFLHSLTLMSYQRNVLYRLKWVIISWNSSSKVRAHVNMMIVVVVREHFHFTFQIQKRSIPLGHSPICENAKVNSTEDNNDTQSISDEESVHKNSDMWFIALIRLFTLKRFLQLRQKWFHSSLELKYAIFDTSPSHQHILLDDFGGFGRQRPVKRFWRRLCCGQQNWPYDSSEMDKSWYRYRLSFHHSSTTEKKSPLNSAHSLPLHTNTCSVVL